MLLGNPPANVETEARTGDVSRPRGSIEGREDLISLIIRHPNAMVGHSDLRFVSKQAE